MECCSILFNILYEWIGNGKNSYAQLMTIKWQTPIWENNWNFRKRTVRLIPKIGFRRRLYKLQANYAAW